MESINLSSVVSDYTAYIESKNVEEKSFLSRVVYTRSQADRVTVNFGKNNINVTSTGGSSPYVLEQFNDNFAIADFLSAINSTESRRLVYKLIHDIQESKCRTYLIEDSVLLLNAVLSIEKDRIGNLLTIMSINLERKDTVAVVLLRIKGKVTPSDMRCILENKTKELLYGNPAALVL